MSFLSPDLNTLLLSVDANKPTYEIFAKYGTLIDDDLTIQSYNRAMFSTLGMQFHIFRQIWQELKLAHKVIRAYTLFAFIDTYRATIKNKEVVYKEQDLPFRAPYDVAILRDIAATTELKRDDYTKTLNLDEFISLFPKLADRQ